MDPALLDILVCPITHSRLHQEGDTLVSEIGGLRYPIKDGLPVLLPDAAIAPPGATLDAIRAAAKKNDASIPSSGQSPPNV